MMGLRCAWTAWALITLFTKDALAKCSWHGDGDNVYDCVGNYDVTVNCTSTVVYGANDFFCANYMNLRSHKDFIINLSNPSENPFLEEVMAITKLTITDGRLVTVPMKVYGMRYLKELKITGNKLRKINLNEFVSMKSLNKIDFGNNTISVIETTEMPKCISQTVKVINLRYNLIETLPNYFIRCFNALEYLDLQHNLIKSIDTHAFQGTYTLKLLDLSYNKLHGVGNAFAEIKRNNESNSDKLEKLYELFLSFNSITFLNFTDFYDTKISKLYIEGNKIPCEVLVEAKNSVYSEQFNKIVTAEVPNYKKENVNGIPCEKAKNENDLNNSVHNKYDFNIPNTIKSEHDAINLLGTEKHDQITSVTNNHVADSISNTNIKSLIDLLKDTIENNSKSLNTLVNIAAESQKSLDYIKQRLNDIDMHLVTLVTQSNKLTGN